MTDPHPTPPPAAAARHEHPFARDPGQWEKARARALRTGHVRDHTCTDDCEPVLVHERTPWGWIAWTVPGDGSPPHTPHQIAVLAPGATRVQRLAVRWLTRRPGRRITLDSVPLSPRLSAAAVTLVSLTAGPIAMRHGVRADIALPAMLLAPLLAEHLPTRLDSRAREHVLTVEGDAACRYLQRLTDLHTSLVQAAAGSDRHELRRSAEVGHNLLWDAARLLQDRDTRAVSDQLIARERLMLQLAHQVSRILQHTARANPPGEDQAPDRGRPLRRCPRTEPTASHPTTAPSPRKGTMLMPPRKSGPAGRAPDVYLLFAHEPYYPHPGTQEINTTVVVADTLLHPRVRQPDGARIHDLLTQGRKPGEIIPLATLTHELNGGAGWPAVGDWEGVTTDLIQLVSSGDCDALSLGLPEIARALMCAAPNTQVRAYDAKAEDFVVYGPAERAAVLDEVAVFLTGIAAEHPFWPGDSLLPPLAGRRGCGP